MPVFYYEVRRLDLPQICEAVGGKLQETSRQARPGRVWARLELPGDPPTFLVELCRREVAGLRFRPGPAGELRVSVPDVPGAADPFTAVAGCAPLKSTRRDGYIALRYPVTRATKHALQMLERMALL